MPRLTIPVRVLSFALVAIGFLPLAASGEWIEHRKIYGSDIDLIDSFGEVMALDGERLLVGDWRKGFGVAYLFERRAGGPERWGEVARLTASDVASDWRFGIDVAIDGDRLVAAAPGADPIGFDEQGAVYVFNRQADGRWLEVAKIPAPPDPDTDSFANSVAVEGDTIFVGSVFDNEVGLGSGAVWVYERDRGGPGNWGLAAKLTSRWPTGQARFGHKLAVDGSILAVAAWQDSERDLMAGAVHIFERATSGDWNEVAKLTASDGGDGDNLGESLAISGWTVVAGAPDHSANYGAAYVFERDETGAWAETAKLTSELDSEDAHIGSSVAIFGKLIILGADGDEIGGQSSGAAHLFVRSSRGWVELIKLKPKELEEFDCFGDAVAAGRGTAIAGATGDDDRGFDAGTAYAYLERDLTLVAVGDCPGQVTLDLTGATVSAPIAVVAGEPGETRIAAGPCTGTDLDLAMPELLRSPKTDANGAWSWTGRVGEPACGSLLQVVDVATCATSEVEATP